jgi:hypothetical protein
VNPQENFADKWQEHPERKGKLRKCLSEIFLHAGERIRKLEEVEPRTP